MTTTLPKLSTFQVATLRDIVARAEKAHETLAAADASAIGGMTPAEKRAHLGTIVGRLGYCPLPTRDVLRRLGLIFQKSGECVCVPTPYGIAVVAAINED